MSCLQENVFDKYLCWEIELMKDPLRALLGFRGAVPSETPPLPEGHRARFPAPPSPLQLDDRSSSEPHFEPGGSHRTRGLGWNPGAAPLAAPCWVPGLGVREQLRRRMGGSAAGCLTQSAAQCLRGQAAPKASTRDAPVPPTHLPLSISALAGSLSISRWGGLGPTV